MNEVQVPKIVDRDQRRAHIAEVVWRIVGERGLDAVTIANVAREAGLSAGTVQYYFADKNDLVVFAMTQTFEGTDARLEGLSEISPAIDAAREMALAILPLNENSRKDVSAWLGFVGKLGTDAALLEMYRAYYARSRARWHAILEQGILDGSIRADISINAETDLLVAVIDGLSMQCVLEGLPTSVALESLDVQLGRLAYRRGHRAEAQAEGTE